MKRWSFIISLLIIFIGVIPIDGCSNGFKERPFNIILISLDTVRADALGYTGNELASTPNIDALARQGFQFTRTISTNSLTTPAHSSLFTGRYPTAHGVHTNGTYALSSSERTLAEFLKEKGYHTAAFVSAFPVSRRFGLSQGFDLYDDRISLPEQEKKAKFRMGAFAQRSAQEVAHAVISWINKRLPAEQPFFLFIHFFDAHAPYAPPPDFIERFGKSKRQRYEAEIAYIDSELGLILTALDKTGVRDRSIFIVTSDHGESLGEHGEETHGLFIYDSTIRIPLFFTGGPIRQGQSSEELVGLIDVFPTIVDLLGFPIPDHLHGRSLKNILLGNISHLNDIPYYIESFLSYESFGWSPLIGLRKNSEKLIRAPRSELYDLRDDPEENKNLYQAQPLHAKKLEDELTRFLKKITEESTSMRPQLSREELTILRSLGYVGAGITAHSSHKRADPKDRLPLFRRMETARLNIHKGENIDSSLTELRKLEKEDPGNLTLRLTIGQTLTALGRLNEAESHYRSLVSDYPHFNLALNELAHLLMKRKAWKEAATYYRKSLEGNPIQVELYPDLVYALARTDRLPEAISIVDAGLDLLPHDLSLQEIRGKLAFQTGDYRTALKYFSSVLAANENDIQAAMNYARALLRNGQSSQAISVLKSFDSLAQENVDFQLLYGQCLAQAGYLKEGKDCFETVLSIEENTSAHYFLGLCYLKMGKIKEAEKHFQKLDDNDPNYKSSRHALKLYRQRKF